MDPTEGEVVRTPDGRRLKLSAELAWLRREIGESSDVPTVAARLSRRTGRAVSPADARRLLATTLVAQGLARLGRDDTVRGVRAEALDPNAGDERAGTLVIVPAATTTRVARAWHLLGTPLALALVAAAGLGACVATLASPPARTAAAWLDGVAWAQAALAWIAAMAAHEWGHAVAFAHAGGAPGPLGVVRLDGVRAFSCGIPGASALPRGPRVAVMLAGSAWQLGAAAIAVAVAAAAGHTLPPPVAAVMLLAPLLEQAPFRHQDGDLVAAALAGAPRGTGIPWTPRALASGSDRALLAHGLVLSVLFAAIAAAAGAGAAALLPATRSAGGLAWLVPGAATVVAAWCAFIAVALLWRAAHRVDPDADRIAPTPPARMLRNAFHAARAMLPVRVLPETFRKSLPLVPVMLSLSFPDRSPRFLRREARRHIAATEMTRLDHEELPRGGAADEWRGARSVRALVAARQGCIVGSLHLGPFHYVALTLFELGAPITVFAADHVKEAWAASWGERGRELGGSFEFLTAGTPRSAVRAMKALEEGRMVVIYMDGQHGAGERRDQHRADFRFCGSELFMRTGPAFLARRAGVPILPAVAFRQGLARRVVEFGAPLPPPDGDDEDALVARTAELYRWFEPHVREHPEQWPGWLYPIVHWRATGSAPTATRAEYDAAIARAATGLAGGRATLQCDPTRTGWIELAREILLVHGPTRRVLQGDPTTRALLVAAQHRVRLRDLPRRMGASPEALAPEVARLTLAGLAELRD